LWPGISEILALKNLDTYLVLELVVFLLHFLKLSVQIAEHGLFLLSALLR
jgi:hypothetical protein